MDARIGDQAVGELEDDAAIQLDSDGAVVEVLVADGHRPEGGQVQRDAADVRLVLLAVFQLLVRLQLADGLEAVADGDAVRLGELDLRGHTGRRVVNTEGPKLGAAEHQLAADLQGQLTLLGDVVVHELREIDVRGDGDDALLHSCAAVLLGALDVVLVVPAARGADVNLFHIVPPIVSASSGR